MGFKILVDVSDVFNSFLLGRGEGGVSNKGEGLDRFFIEHPRRGTFRIFLLLGRGEGGVSNEGGRDWVGFSLKIPGGGGSPGGGCGAGRACMGNWGNWGGGVGELNLFFGAETPTKKWEFFENFEN